MRSNDNDGETARSVWLMSMMIIAFGATNVPAATTKSIPTE